MRKKYFRPCPIPSEINPDFIELNKRLSFFEYFPTDFLCWKVIPLIRNRKKVSIIHLHWPESTWRSTSFLYACIKAFQFILVFYFAKFLGYKYVWSAHNVFPHFKVSFNRLEFKMRKFILKNFDAIIGVAKNTRTDLESMYNVTPKLYAEALHPHYEGMYPESKEKKSLRDKIGIAKDKKIVLVMNNTPRENRGIEEVLDQIDLLTRSDKIAIIITGIIPSEYEHLKKRENVYFLPGKIPNEEMSFVFNSINFLFLNYKNMTTSGLFFLALTFEKPVIAPDIPFFKCHASDDIAVLFDSKKSLTEAWPEIEAKILSDWIPDSARFLSVKEEHNIDNTVKNVANVYDQVLGIK